MSVDVHDCLDVLKSQSFLDFFDSSTSFKQKGAVGVSKSMWGNSFEVWIFLQTFENESFDCHFFNDWKKILYNFGLMIVEMCILTLGLSSLYRLV